MLESLRELNAVSILVRMVFAMAFGGLIGLEREHKRMPAGFRTYMLVCLGASLAAVRVVPAALGEAIGDCAALCAAEYGLRNQQ